METNNSNKENNQVPSISESELKLPDEQFGEQSPVPAPKSHFNPLLFGLLIALLVIMSLVVIWGEQLINLVLPPENTEPATITETEEVPPETAGTQQDLSDIESELNEMDFSTIDNELDAIGTQLETEASSSASIETTTEWWV